MNEDYTTQLCCSRCQQWFTADHFVGDSTLCRHCVAETVYRKGLRRGKKRQEEVVETPATVMATLSTSRSQELFTQHALHDPDITVRCFCVSKLEDVALLKRLAAHDHEYTVRYAAIIQIEDVEFLQVLYDNLYPESGLRGVIVERLCQLGEKPLDME